MSRKKRSKRKLEKGMKMLGGYHRKQKAGLKVRRKKREELNKKQLERQKKLPGVKKRKRKGKWMKN